ncbi:MAG: hypothetical protein ACE5I1_31030 [bacterium]
MQAFEYVWTTVRDKHYDLQFNGVDWQAVHDELLPEMQSAKTVRQARSVLEEMLSRLGLSHFGIIPAELYENIDTPVGREFSDGETGMDVRVIDGKVLVTAVIKNSQAELAGIRTGWQAAYDKIKNRVVESTLEIKGQGITLSVTVYAAKPNNMYVIAESDATGKVERGVIDGVVWEKSLMAGAQVKEGDERADVLRDAAFDRFAYWQQTYEKVECVSIDTVNAKPCYKVVMTPKQGAAQSFYFDKESGLLEMAESEIRSQMGTLPIKAILSDYKEVDGLLISHHLKVEIMGQTRIATTNSVRHNVDLPADRFDPPEDVKALLEKK